MASKPLRVSLLGGVLATGMLYSGVGYITGIVPFPVQQRGDLSAAALCDSLGNGEVASTQLEKVLPSRGEYSSQGQAPPRPRSETSWNADCTVYGGDDQLLYASSELGWDASAETWLEGSSREYVDDEGKGDEFHAGRAAVMMKHTAEILVPCLRREGTHPLQLVIVVHAQEPLVGSAEENRNALATLALGAARSAHERADCSLPSRIPARVTGLN